MTRSPFPKKRTARAEATSPPDPNERLRLVLKAGFLLLNPPADVELVEPWTSFTTWSQVLHALDVEVERACPPRGPVRISIALQAYAQVGKLLLGAFARSQLAPTTAPAQTDEPLEHVTRRYEVH